MLGLQSCAGAREPCLLDHPLHERSTSEPLLQLFHTGAAARWRRRPDDYFVPAPAAGAAPDASSDAGPPAGSGPGPGPGPGRGRDRGSGGHPPPSPPPHSSPRAHPYPHPHSRPRASAAHPGPRPHVPPRLSAVRQRRLEDVHGVDVSWLHHTGSIRAQHLRRKPVPSPPQQPPPPSTRPPLHTHMSAPATPARRPNPLPPMPAPAPGSSHDEGATKQQQQQHPMPAVVTPAAAAEPARDNTNVPALPTTPNSSSSTNPSPANGKPKEKRPILLARHSSAGKAAGTEGGRRTSSWLNNISSKFSSSPAPAAAAATTTTTTTPPTTTATTPERPALAPVQPSKSTVNGTPPPANRAPAPTPHPEEAEEVERYTPPKAKDSTSSFFSNLTRRLSSASQATVPKVHGTGGVCPRKVLNVDPNRERCLLPEMDVNRLRKVSFCVDVEVAGPTRYHDEHAAAAPPPDDDVDRKRKKKDAKLKERAEGEALKRPQALQAEKERESEVKLDAQGSKAVNIPQKAAPAVNGTASPEHDSGDDEETSPPTGSSPGETMSRKKEKKKKSEEERKVRRDNRRRRAEESGSVPVEMQYGADHADNTSAGYSPAPFPGSGTAGLDTPLPFDQDAAHTFQPSSVPSTPTPPAASARHDRPTTDPVRIYRRCCQLRETPILKRITEQLMNPACMVPFEPGVVNCLDLTSSRLQLADVQTLGDWLAVVPVKKLRLEDADLSDEGVRYILAGLLAAKRPEPTRRKSATPRHRERVRPRQYQERSGVIEKITFKFNPRMTRVGWKHISLFIYLCRSLKSIDMSMNPFPDTLPASAHVSPVKNSENAPLGDGQDTDAAETLYKSLSGRLGGNQLEELIVSECDLSAVQIRKVVFGAIMCGVSRLGLAGNNIDDAGLDHIIHYIRSGVCEALDIGGNKLHGKLGKIADAISQQVANKKNLACWGLSLASCNLTPSDLKELFPALAKLPNFRFIDLSHNRDLCTESDDTISLFRRYMAKFTELKRIHLADVGMSPKQAIALADCLPDGPRLAHLNILENPQLTALAHAQGEASQEEACAVYASLMAAVRVSSTLICIDIDPPSNDNSEVVKALAKQVVAYSLRNMEQFAIAEATGSALPTTNGTAQYTHAHSGDKPGKEITVPDVLMHLVGHIEGCSENHDDDAPAPDDDYIVGGTGVVKALQYVLGEKANDLRRGSVPGSPISGTVTPREGRPGSSAGLVPTAEQRGKARKMSKDLLDSARKIRARLQPALAKEAHSGNELAYRRLLFLDQTLQSMIQRFEEEYPETRVTPRRPKPTASISSSASSQSDARTNLSLNTQATDLTNQALDDDELDDGLGIHPPALRRHDSEVSLASRAQTLEEGRVHRLGQHLRREVIDSPSVSQAPDAPWKASEDARIRAVGEKMDKISGAELQRLVEAEGWDTVLRKIGGNYEDLRSLQELDPEGWEQFKESQMKARLNLDRGRSGNRGP